MNQWKTGLLCFCVVFLSVSYADSQLLSKNKVKKLQQLQSNQLLRVATWNVEHLAYPIDLGCKPRSDADIKKMRQYAESIKADVVALQEVSSIRSIQLLFPETEWQVVLSARPDSESYDCRGSGNKSTQQKVAFAVRKPLSILNVDQGSKFALGSPGLRYALGITINSVEGPIELLNLHLKSGCFVDDFRQKDSDACQTFARQAPILDQWIEEREKNHSAYIILGDLNHRISAPYNRLTQLISNNSNGTPSKLTVATQQLIGCHPRYPAPIDHIIVGGRGLKSSVSNSQAHRYEVMDEDAMLSDHCAISIDLFEKRFPLSTAVKWQTKSKEYQLLLKSLYLGAGEALKKKALPNEPWVVVMDLDETVLDNSHYQVTLDQTGRSYSSATWDNWVMSERASLVPGAEEFIDIVFSLGGRLALVTNRKKQLDSHTWRNLISLGLPMNTENTCLMGRSPADKLLSEKEGIINDKDKRRQKIRSGTADCYSPDTKNSNWQKPHKINFQVGDNIEDIGGVTQENAKPTELLKRWDDDVLILPNPMYGSW